MRWSWCVRRFIDFQQQIAPIERSVENRNSCFVETLLQSPSIFDEYSTRGRRSNFARFVDWLGLYVARIRVQTMWNCSNAFTVDVSGYASTGCKKGWEWWHQGELLKFVITMLHKLGTPVGFQLLLERRRLSITLRDESTKSSLPRIRGTIPTSGRKRRVITHVVDNADFDSCGRTSAHILHTDQHKANRRRNVLSNVWSSSYSRVEMKFKE